MKSGLSGEFFGAPIVEYIDGNMWRLIQEPARLFGLVVKGFGPVTPTDGFFFDFASIPAPVRWLYPKAGSGKGGHYGPAAVIHDFLYSYPKINGANIPRELADKIFLLGMELEGVRPTLRALFYLAVRVGGGAYFGKPDRLNRLRGGADSNLS